MTRRTWMRVLGGLCLALAATALPSAQAPTYTWVLLAGGEASYHRDDVGTRARFNRPGAIVESATGVVYVADYGNHTIRRIATDRTVTTVAGAPDQSGATDGNGAAARFAAPTGVVVDSNGVLWVADAGNFTIRRIATNGDVTTVAGVAGVTGATDGVGAAARFGPMQKMAIDASGNIYVAESAGTTGIGNRIRRVTPSGEVTTLGAFMGATGLAVTTAGTVHVASAFLVHMFNGTTFVQVAGSPSTPGTQDGTGSAARFSNISALAADQSGNVIAYDAERFRQVTPAGVVTTLPSLDPRGVFSDLESVVSMVARTDGSFLLSSVVTRVIKTFSSSAGFGNFAGSMGHGTADGARTTAEFYVPMQLSLDQRGNLIVADSFNHTIRRVAPDGMVTTLSGLGRAPNYAGGAVGDARHRYPSAVASPDGTVTMIDTYNQLVRRVANGVVTDLAGQFGQTGFVNGTGTDARFDTGFLLSPPQVAVDTAGTMYLPDSRGHAIRSITSGGVVETFAGVIGAGGSDDGPASDARFSNPLAIARDAAGNLYVTQYTAVRQITQAGVVSTITTARGGTAIAVDSDGTLLVGDGDLYRLALNGDRTTIGKPDFGRIGGVAVGPAREIYLSMHNNGGPEVNRLWVGLPSAAAAPIVGSVASQVKATGETARFSSVITGMPTPGLQWQRSTDGGTTWSDLPEAAPFSGTATALLSVSSVTPDMHTHQFRVHATNLDGTATSNAATLTVYGIVASPGTLRFAARRLSASDAYTTTAAQPVTVRFTGGGDGTWNTSADQSWVQITGGFGVGAGQFTIGINESAMHALTGTQTATVTISRSPQFSTTVSVTLTIDPNFDFGAPPFGVVDTPLQDTAGVQGAISMSGWVLDDLGVRLVRIYRNCAPFESGRGYCVTLSGLPQLGPVVELGDATFVSGARPDVEAVYPNYPQAHRAGWGFMILSNMLPDIPASQNTGGVGPFTFHALAFTEPFAPVTPIGRAVGDQTGTRVTAANDTIAKPFGAIDTPTQGQTVSGTLNNFGWALTPDPGTSVLVPTDGSTITVYIDGAPVGTATYNLCRGTVGNPVPSGVLCNDDVSTAFRGAGTLFRNLDAARGPIGLRSIDTTALTNGLHTISWGVTDSANRSEGIGSRYFTALNGSSDAPSGDAPLFGGRSFSSGGSAGSEDPASDNQVPASGVPVYARTGFDLLSAYTPLVRGAGGVSQVRMPELGRVELRIPGVQSGALIINGESRALPIGMAIDAAQGVVTWAPGPGYLGTYHLAFDGVMVDVTVAPAAEVADAATRMYLDFAGSVPSPSMSLGARVRTVRVEGWALDPAAASGAGIGAVHVWAQSRSAECAVRSAEPGCAPVFLGVADINLARPDVAAAHGAQFPDAGFRFTGVLPAGEWDVTAYVWVTRTGRFEDARSTRVVVR